MIFSNTFDNNTKTSNLIIGSIIKANTTRGLSGKLVIAIASAM